jgi:hypothetical protein
MNITCNLTFMDKLRHLLNPLHVYCRLTHLGLSRKVARDLCKAYEVCVYKQTIGRF